MQEQSIDRFRSKPLARISKVAADCRSSIATKFGNLCDYLEPLPRQELPKQRLALPVGSGGIQYANTGPSRSSENLCDLDSIRLAKAIGDAIAKTELDRAQAKLHV